MNDGAPMTKGMMRLDHRSHNHTVCNMVGTISEMRMMLKLSFQDVRMIIKFMITQEINLR